MHQISCQYSHTTVNMRCLAELYDNSYVGQLRGLKANGKTTEVQRSFSEWGNSIRSRLLNSHVQTEVPWYLSNLNHYQNQGEIATDRLFSAAEVRI